MTAPSRSVLTLVPAAPVHSRGFDLDALEIEYGDDGAVDFRLVLGRGLEIFWLLPIADRQHLRLVQVDAASYHLERSLVHAETFTIDIPRQEWRGRLAELRNGRWIEEVALEIHDCPSAYRVDVRVRSQAGTDVTTTFAWEGPAPLDGDSRPSSVEHQAPESLGQTVTSLAASVAATIALDTNAHPGGSVALEVIATPLGIALELRVASCQRRFTAGHLVYEGSLDQLRDTLSDPSFAGVLSSAMGLVTSGLEELEIRAGVRKPPFQDWRHGIAMDVPEVRALVNACGQPRLAERQHGPERERAARERRMLSIRVWSVGMGDREVVCTFDPTDTGVERETNLAIPTERLIFAIPIPNGLAPPQSMRWESAGDVLAAFGISTADARRT